MLSREETSTPCTTISRSMWSCWTCVELSLTCCSYFSDIDRLFGKEYVPSDQDILRARLRTTGINETIFEVGNRTYRMFDVGGQRSERKKWIHAFDNVNVVLFLVAISGYDHVLVEDRNGVRPK